MQLLQLKGTKLVFSTLFFFLLLFLFILLVILTLSPNQKTKTKTKTKTKADDRKKIQVEVVTIKDKIKSHDTKQRAQRAGMNEMRDNILQDLASGMFHMDAKSKYRVPRMWVETRNIGNEKYIVHAIGKCLVFQGGVLAL